MYVALSGFYDDALYKVTYLLTYLLMRRLITGSVTLVILYWRRVDISNMSVGQSPPRPYSRAYATVLRPSVVCNVCIVVKQCVLPKNKKAQLTLTNPRDSKGCKIAPIRRVVVVVY